MLALKILHFFIHTLNKFNLKITEIISFMDCRRRQNREYAAMRSIYIRIYLYRTKQVRDNNYFY